MLALSNRITRGDIAPSRQGPQLTFWGATLGAGRESLDNMRDFKGMKRQRSRNRGGGGSGGGGGGKPQHNANRAFESNGPDGVKIRGAAQHVFEKYQQLARDALTAGDRVLGESYQQHAEHYFRVLRAVQPQRPPSDIIGRDAFTSGVDIDFEDEGGDNDGGQDGSDGDGDRGEPRNEWRQDSNRQDANRQDNNLNDLPPGRRPSGQQSSGRRRTIARSPATKVGGRSPATAARPPLLATTVLATIARGMTSARRQVREDRPRDERPRDERPRDERPREDRPAARAPAPTRSAGGGRADRRAADRAGGTAELADPAVAGRGPPARRRPSCRLASRPRPRSRTRPRRLRSRPRPRRPPSRSRPAKTARRVRACAAAARREPSTAPPTARPPPMWPRTPKAN